MPTLGTVDQLKPIEAAPVEPARGNLRRAPQTSGGGRRGSRSVGRRDWRRRFATVVPAVEPAIDGEGVAGARPGRRDAAAGRRLRRRSEAVDAQRLPRRRNRRSSAAASAARRPRAKPSRKSKTAEAEARRGRKARAVSKADRPRPPQSLRGSKAGGKAEAIAGAATGGAPSKTRGDARSRTPAASLNQSAASPTRPASVGTRACKCIASTTQIVQCSITANSSQGLPSRRQLLNVSQKPINDLTHRGCR